MSKFLRFRMPQQIGLFATLSHCLFLCHYCLEKDIWPIFSIENDLYGSDWFNRLFRHRLSPTGPADEIESIALADRLEINLFTRGAKENEISDELTSIEQGAHLFHHFLEIRGEITQEIEANATRLVAEYTVGIHYRGTDKFTLESAPVSYDDVCEAAERAAGETGFIYLATDDLDFFEVARERVPPDRLRYLRRPGGRSHYLEPGTFEKALDALTDAVLLSKCSLLVKTPSILSAWSVIFNPALPFILVGEPKRQPSALDYALRNGVGFFPENILHQRKERAARVIRRRLDNAPVRVAT